MKANRNGDNKKMQGIPSKLKQCESDRVVWRVLGGQAETEEKKTKTASGFNIV